MKWLLRTVLALAVLLLGGAAWLLGTSGGLRWALGFAPPQLVVEAPRGALAREISAERVAWEGIEARNVSFQLNLLALLADTVSVNFLRVETLSLKRPEGRMEQDSNFVLPLRIKVSDRSSPAAHSGPPQPSRAL